MYIDREYCGRSTVAQSDTVSRQSTVVDPLQVASADLQSSDSFPPIHCQSPLSPPPSTGVPVWEIKMVMNVEIISKDIIKPSSPTPHHLKNLKLSFLDQLAPPVYVPIIFFYQAESDPKTDHFDRSCWLKKSLADTLTRFYPLAGTIMEDFSVDCNDEGIEFIEARVASNLSEIIEEPDVKVLNQFLPFKPCGNEKIGSKREVLLGVQFNIFDCGGVAIGGCISHNIADASSAIAFINSWAATSRGTTSEPINPIFNAASHFPAREISGFGRNIWILTDKVVTRRFVFDKSNISALKEEASSSINTDVDSLVKQPTRVEAVSAFIWQRFMAIARSKSVYPKVTAALHVVNLRPRMVPPLPMNSIGNFWDVAIAPISTVEVDQKEYHKLVSEIRNSIRRVDSDYVKKLQSGDGYMDSLKKTSEMLCKGEMELCNFSSWCRFPLYEVDFGWGKPTRVCNSSMPMKDAVFLMSTRDGDGIEAWVNLLEEDMAIFERDLKLVS